jgi:uncharacterized lipoprotein YajG
MRVSRKKIADVIVTLVGVMLLTGCASINTDSTSFLQNLPASSWGTDNFETASEPTHPLMLSGHMYY